MVRNLQRRTDMKIPMIFLTGVLMALVSDGCCKDASTPVGSGMTHFWTLDTSRMGGGGHSGHH